MTSVATKTIFSLGRLWVGYGRSHPKTCYNFGAVVGRSQELRRIRPGVRGAATVKRMFLYVCRRDDYGGRRFAYICIRKACAEADLRNLRNKFASNHLAQFVPLAYETPRLTLSDVRPEPIRTLAARREQLSEKEGNR